MKQFIFSLFYYKCSKTNRKRRRYVMVNEIISGLGVLVPVVIVGAGGVGIVGSGYVKAHQIKPTSFLV